jgi:DNA polymerase elongation subunit (family B)
MITSTPTYKLNPNHDCLLFQCKDIVSRDAVPDMTVDSDSGSEPGSYGGEATKEYQILLFGTDQKGQSVAVQVTDFKPYFYVRIPDILRTNATAHTNLERWISNKVAEQDLCRVKFVVEEHLTLMDYTGGTKAVFLKIIVPTIALWRELKDQFLEKSTSTPIPYETASFFGTGAIKALETTAANNHGDVSSVTSNGKLVALKIYEANIDPVLRFFHEQNISPAGWVQIPAGKYEWANSNDAKVNVFVSAEWQHVQASSQAGMAPFLVGSWDIECNSSHGDFPVAIKTWKKPIRELHEHGMPTTLEEFCSKLGDAIKGRGPLSPIYLNPKKQKVPLTAETLLSMINSQKQGDQVRRYLQAIKAATKPDDREKAMSDLDALLSFYRGPKNGKQPPVFPYGAIAGDEIIQIGIVLYRQAKPISKHIWVLKSVDAATVRPPGEDVPIEVYSFEDEATMIKAWFQWLGKTDPDILIGYNIFGFDSKYVWERLESLVGKEQTLAITAPLTALRSRPTKLEEKFLSSSAMGDNTMHFMNSAGRLQIDLLPYIRRNHNLDSYSLDNVSATFVSGSVKSLTQSPTASDQFVVATKSTKGTLPGRFITLMDDENDRLVEKAEVLAVEPTRLIIRIKGGADALKEHGTTASKWAQVKDDVSPKDIFRFYKGTAKERGIVARYCLQDCDLVMELFHKLDILNNSVAMANVCSVPVSFIFLRGQGIKIESLIFKECRKADQLIEVMPQQPRRDNNAPDLDESDEPKEEDDSYEGAIVLEPKTGIYINDPITADDFASLYPSSIISENISHDTLIWVKDYDTNADGTIKAFKALKEGSDRFDNLPGEKYVNIEFDILKADPMDERKHPTKIRDGKRIARYIQTPQGSIPRILEMLLSSRKACRKQAEKEPDEFKKALLDAQQLAYKLTANSLYGQLGSATFKVRRQVLAASTTAYGRKQLMYAKAVIEKLYGNGNDPRCDAECVYGDTDSIFLRFRPKDPATGKPLTGDAALKAAKDLTIESGKLVSSCLKPPHDFEFDKIFRTFCLLSKKRYVGDMSEDGLNPDDFHRKSMGIVMKRRDNAPIVKFVYGGAIERILDPTRPPGSSGVKDAFDFVQTTAKDLLKGNVPMTKLMITKSLRAGYANPSRIAHKVLADRIAERDPGNKPSTSERMSFVYIQSEATLQGDRIETPAYIREHNLKPDYVHYITNQIAKPVSQLFALELEKLPGVKQADLDQCLKSRDPVAAREKLAESILFGALLKEESHRPEVMEAKGQRSIAAMFGKK